MAVEREVAGTDSEGGATKSEGVEQSPDTQRSLH